MGDQSYETNVDNIGPDMRQYAALLWQWAWLILLAAVVAGAAAFIISMQLKPQYESTSTLLVNAATSSTQVTDYNAILTSNQLTTTYAQMMVTQPVLGEVIQR